MRAASEKLRVLHVLGSLSRGGIETWLLHVVRKSQGGPVAHDFLLTGKNEGPYAAEARALGSSIYCVGGNGRAATLKNVWNVLSSKPKYDIVHSHTHYFSGAVLAMAKLARIPVRIAHVHTMRTNEATHGLRGAPYRFLMRAGLRWSQTHGLAISQNTAKDFFGSDWQEQKNVQVLLYGFDFSKFRGANERRLRIRDAWGVPADAVVMGNIARFVPFKNHAFLIDVFSKFLETRPNSRLVLIGSGPLQADVQAKVDALHLQDKVVFAGETDDIAGAFGAMDLFVLPSWTEGLGIVIVEAQAAGRCALVTNTMPAEVDIAPGGVTRVALSDGADVWAGRAVDVLEAPKAPPHLFLESVLRSEFDIERCVAELTALYRRAALQS